MKNENDNISFHSDEEEGSSEDDGSREISLSEYSFHYSEEDFNATLKGIKKNSAETKALDERGLFDYIDNMTDEAWEELGRDISNNTHLTKVKLSRGALNDQKISFFFRELTRSSSIEQLSLFDNELSVAGVRSIVPFLQNTNSLRELYLHSNNIQSEGFNLLLRSLSNSPIERLGCCECGIASIEIDCENIPKHLTHLNLHDNRINADGCRELAKLLEGEDTTLTDLYLDNNKIDDEGVTILVNALRTNRSLLDLSLQFNDGISDQGQIMLLKLVNDVSSIKAALQSNHTLWYIPVNFSDEKEHIQMHICEASTINNDEGNPEAAGRMKIIDTQLRSDRRAELAELQGVSQSLYSEISPLHLPEVLALAGLYHGQGELYKALKTSIAGLITIVNRKQCLLQQRASKGSRDTVENA